VSSSNIHPGALPATAIASATASSQAAGPAAAAAAAVAAEAPHAPAVVQFKQEQHLLSGMYPNQQQQQQQRARSAPNAALLLPMGYRLVLVNTEQCPTLHR
jgi:hypothetical protein